MVETITVHATQNEKRHIANALVASIKGERAKSHKELDKFGDSIRPRIIKAQNRLSGHVQRAERTR